MDVVERARKYLEKAEDPRRALSDSQDSHLVVFKAAVALVQGFALPEDLAKTLLKEYCERSDEPWTEREVDHKLRQASRAQAKGPIGYLLGGNTPRISEKPRGHANAPKPERQIKRPDFDRAALDTVMVRDFHPDFAWLAERSPIDPRNVSPAAFLDTIFEPGEKTLIFIRYYSQGELGHVAGNPGKTYYLGDRPDLRPTPAEAIPHTGREGAWFLPSPIDGKWHPSGSVDKQGNPTLSRRSGPSVVKYRHMLLESDDLAPGEWLNLLCQMALPISALYTSGDRSVHALVRVDCESKSGFDAFRDRISPLLSKLGADPGVLSGVRLTRLPGVMREGKTKEGKYIKFEKPRLQQLLFLNPAPTVLPLVPLKTLPRLREVKSTTEA